MQLLKRTTVTICLIALFYSCVAYPQLELLPSDSVYFTPSSNVAQIIIDEISAAKSEIMVSCYGMSNTAIIYALSSAGARGLHVTILCDRSQYRTIQRYEPLLISNNVLIVRKRAGQLMHNKTLIIDRRTVITGSYNLSYPGLRQDNNTLILRHDTKIINSYVANWIVLYNRDTCNNYQ